MQIFCFWNIFESSCTFQNSVYTITKSWSHIIYFLYPVVLRLQKRQCRKSYTLRWAWVCEKVRRYFVQTYWKDQQCHFSIPISLQSFIRVYKQTSTWTGADLVKERRKIGYPVTDKKVYKEEIKKVCNHTEQCSSINANRCHDEFYNILRCCNCFLLECYVNLRIKCFDMDM